MRDYCKYDDLPYRPTEGMVEVRGTQSEWGVRVSVEQGRAMEADGIPVMWPYASVPGWVADMGLAHLWVSLSRLWSWPSRLR